jgi:hypothetical protein
MMTPSLISGASYRLANDTKIGNCIFKNGEVVIYTSGGYSHYDDCYIYHFINSVGEKRICVSQTELTGVEIENFDKIAGA